MPGGTPRSSTRRGHTDGAGGPGVAPHRDPSQKRAIAEPAAGLEDEPVDEARAQRPADLRLPSPDVFGAVPAGVEGGGQASGADGVADAEAPEGILGPRGLPGEEEVVVQDRRADANVSHAAAAPRLAHREAELSLEEIEHALQVQSLAVKIVEQADGKGCPTLMDEEVAIPLGARRSSSTAKEPSARSVVKR